MRPATIFGPLALSGAAAALSGSYPWVLLSTTKFQDVSHRSQIQTGSEVLKHTQEILATCPTDRYLVAVQPGVHATDLGRSMPHLRRAFEDSRILGRFDVAEVVGAVDTAGVVEHIKSECAKKNKAVTVDEVHLASLASQDRASTLSKNDGILAGSLETTAKDDSYTILFLSAPGEPAQFVESLHTDLKRDVNAMHFSRMGNNTRWESLPLFEKYQFFTPGIFMGLIVALILLSILGVGLRALSSLEVSYGAFEKEMGPAAHKKQQ
ncbi:vacuolar ATP synthase subunit s1 (ATP6S1) domain-containing protein [Hirsutella rhossiliensis]|uniref:Protein BIG1 n=1 Tax=Hirsutella rhossiliensis TaxID=111463 RepID=A0A9P8SL73_9HYPO|nr:vacuolar ATP synthase subunit s1 (ATP6S1) domain-containing protein [Hirsutella rhossiliensis]KAH0964851.1 vacuolar ATP synthase subunit s1 (ATP6S1) domain-containing protein [Hirsutella rhossiliensis]